MKTKTKILGALWRISGKIAKWFYAEVEFILIKTLNHLLDFFDEAKDFIKKPAHLFVFFVGLGSIIFWTGVAVRASFEPIRAEYPHTIKYVIQKLNEIGGNKTDDPDVIYIQRGVEEGVKDQKESQASEELPESKETKQLEKNSTQDVVSIIENICNEQGVDAELVKRIAFCESSYNPVATNPHSSATGLFQILDMHGLSYQERIDPVISTKWAVNRIKTVGTSPWNASKHCWNKS